MPHSRVLGWAFRDLLRCVWPPEDDAPPGGFRYIPIRPDHFCELLDLAVALCPGTPRPVFCDAGCGPGVNVKLASLMGRVVAHGVELNRPLVDFARGYSNCMIHEADIRTFDYSPYDLVYWYRPLRDGYDEWLQHVVACVRPGAVLITAGFAWTGPMDGVRVVHRLNGSEVLVKT